MKYEEYECLLKIYYTFQTMDDTQLIPEEFVARSVAKSGFLLRRSKFLYIFLYLYCTVSLSYTRTESKIPT